MPGILVIGDIHCKVHFLKKAEKFFEDNQCEYLVFLGDACDDWGATQDDNIAIVRYLIDLKQKLGDKFVWLIGNHDWGYYAGRKMSGHIKQNEAAVHTLLLQHKNAWGIAHQIGCLTFSHAGISQEFAERYGGSDIINNFNRLKDDVSEYSPLNNVGFSSGGWSWAPSPIWYRPPYEGIESWNEGGVQIVGHTPVSGIHRYKNFVMCDTFSLNSDRTPIGDQTMLYIEEVPQTPDWNKFHIIDNLTLKEVKTLE